MYGVSKDDHSVETFMACGCCLGYGVDMFAAWLCRGGGKETKEENFDGSRDAGYVFSTEKVYSSESDCEVGDGKEGVDA